MPVPECNGYNSFGFEAKTASAYKTGEWEDTIPGEYHLQIVCDGESIYVAHSDCPTQDCVRTAKATHPGQSIVCLPEQVIIKVVGMKTQSDPDLIIG